MMHIGIFGSMLIYALVLWPFLISTVLSFFRLSFRREFFLSSLLVGYFVYLFPVFLQHIGAPDGLEEETRIHIEWLKLVFPLVTSLCLSVYWGKIRKQKRNIIG
jgi:hypothetical protein